MESIVRIDKKIGETLIGLRAIVNEKLKIESSSVLSPEDKKAKLSDLKFKVKFIHKKFANNFDYSIGL